jgi:hypothetical protein
MLVRCQINKGSDLGEFRRGLFYTLETSFAPLRVDHVYQVFGMSLFRDVHLGEDIDPRPEWYPSQAGLAVLICHVYETPPTLRPDWYPIELFSIEDAGVPEGWEFSTVAQFGMSPVKKSNVLARWGYSRLVHSDEHREGLISRDPKALAEFREEFELRSQDLPARSG